MRSSPPISFQAGHLSAIAMTLLLSTSLLAQNVAGVISPNPAPIGTSVTLTITNGSGAMINLPSSCAASSVHSGGPNGPIVSGFFCLTVITPLAPCATRSQTFTPSPALPAGTYWFRVDYFQPLAPGLSTEWFCFDYVQPPTQRLGATTPARIGQSLLMNIGSPNTPSVPYIAAASLTTNVGLPILPGVSLCLDPDFLFNLSFPSPDPILFANFQGTLDASGNALNLTVNIPNLPVLLCRPLHVQAAILSTSGLRLTNTCNFAIGP